MDKKKQKTITFVKMYKYMNKMMQKVSYYITSNYTIGGEF